jgi:hypothetical protein
VVSGSLGSAAPSTVDGSGSPDSADPAETDADDPAESDAGDPEEAVADLSAPAIRSGVGFSTA